MTDSRSWELKFGPRTLNAELRRVSDMSQGQTSYEATALNTAGSMPQGQFHWVTTLLGTPDGKLTLLKDSAHSKLSGFYRTRIRKTFPLSTTKRKDGLQMGFTRP